jgi:hypothetical protein
VLKCVTFGVAITQSHTNFCQTPATFGLARQATFKSWGVATATLPRVHPFL